jgi:hypothetical protein
METRAPNEETTMLRIELETTKDSFVESDNAEIARILRGLAMNFENGARESCHGRLRDSNGNVCGQFLFEVENDNT